MCLKPRPLPPIPEETREIGERLFDKTTLPRQLGDEYSDVLPDEEFRSMYSNLGQPAYSPARLTVVSLLQANEHLPDRAAAYMVRARMDWKYALHLPLNDLGFDPSILCEYRERVIRNERERMVFDRFLERLQENGWLKGRKKQRTDSLAIFGAIRELNRLELVMETLRLALEGIVQCEPEWFAEHVPDAWVDRYAEWTQAERIVKERGAKGAAKTQALLIRTGRDGFTLLDALAAESTPADLWELESVTVMETVWLQQYQRVPQGAKPVNLPVENQLCEEMAALRRRRPRLKGEVDWEAEAKETHEAKETRKGTDGVGSTEETSTKKDGDDDGGDDQTGGQDSAVDNDRNKPANDIALSTVSSRKADGIKDLIATPHDPEARYVTKRGKSSTGFKLHLTETATEDAPAIITDLDVVKAAAYDADAVGPGQRRLEERGLLPEKQLLDSGYVWGQTLEDSARLGVELIGPILPDISGPARKAAGFAAEDFEVGFARQEARCPAGHLNSRWSVKERSDQPGQRQAIIQWSAETCGGCPHRGQCVGSKQSHRILALSEHYPRIAARRAEQTTEAFMAEYRRRAGIEATFSNITNGHGGRRTPYRGKSKTLLHYATLAVGINLQRVGSWSGGVYPKRTRNTVLGRLKAERKAPESGPEAQAAIIDRRQAAA